VKNNKKEKIQMLLKDQYPISSSKRSKRAAGKKRRRSEHDYRRAQWKLQLLPEKAKTGSAIPLNIPG